MCSRGINEPLTRGFYLFYHVDNIRYKYILPILEKWMEQLRVAENDLCLSVELSVYLKKIHS